jgi:nucleotide-binding universal stress UspA family protein
MLEIKLILCPIDFSEFSERVYQHALSLAWHYQANLVVQHVVELWRYPSASFAASAEVYDEFGQALRERGKKQLREFVENYTHDEIHPELAVHQGLAPDSILSFAQAQKADVIVMGTHGRRGYDRLMLGSVTDRVMRTPCRMDENSGRRLFVFVGHHPSSHPDGHFHSREAAARIGKSDFKGYAGTLFASFTTLPEIPQDDVVAQFGIPGGDVSLDVQDGQSVHATFV